MNIKIDIRKNAAVCPKLNSTNPGLDIFAIPDGTTAQKFQDTNCKSPKGEKIAKYKLSTSCSYTPSLLGYYHVSRILGHVANVPPAVLRTYDLADHIVLGRKALTRAPASSLIHATWAALMARSWCPTTFATPAFLAPRTCGSSGSSISASSSISRRGYRPFSVWNAC